jgi:diguanylate cyclase (GGDEF)-like protein
VHAEIDDFAGITERFGVSIGSVLLKEVSGVIAGCIRDMDYAARMGGARFSLLLTETDRMGAYYVADRLRQQVEAFYLERQIGGRPFAITVSAGVAAFPQDADSAEDLVAKACEAYYNARARGPGSVAIHYRERREYIRLESPTDRLKVTLLPEGDTAAALADMKNISSGGVLFESDRPMQLGRMVQIQCRNLQEGEEVLIPGRVVRIERFDTEGAERYEIGVLFDLVVEQQLEGVIGFLERFIAGEETPGFQPPGSELLGSDPAGPA